MIENDVQTCFQGLCISKDGTKQTAACKGPLGEPRVASWWNDQEIYQMFPCYQKNYRYKIQSIVGGELPKNLPANARDTGDAGSIPGSRRFPWGGNGNPLQYSCLDNPVDKWAWQKSWTWLSDWATEHACTVGWCYRNGQKTTGLAKN